MHNISATTVGQHALRIHPVLLTCFSRTGASGRQSHITTSSEMTEMSHSNRAVVQYAVGRPLSDGGASATTGSPTPAGRASTRAYSPSDGSDERSSQSPALSRSDSQSQASCLAPYNEKAALAAAWYGTGSTESATPTEDGAPHSTSPRSSTFLLSPRTVSPSPASPATMPPRIPLPAALSPLSPASAYSASSPLPLSTPSDALSAAHQEHSPLSPLPPPASPYAWDHPPPSSEYLPGPSRRNTFRSSRTARSSIPSPPYAPGEGPYPPFDFTQLARVGEGLPGVPMMPGVVEDGRSERSALPAYSQY